MEFKWSVESQERFSTRPGMRESTEALVREGFMTVEDVERGFFRSGELPPATPAQDPVNHPSHYTSHPAKCGCGAQIECIQITEHMGFNLGNAIKYLWRADLKGAAIQDLEKAKWYIEREIAKRKAEQA